MSFQNSISALYSYRAPVQPALGPLCPRCMTCMNQCFVLFAGSEQSMYCTCDAQSRLANIIYSSDRTGRLWWVTEQNKDGAKRGCAVLEGRSTRLSFFFFVVCLSYHFKWQTASNVFIFLCCNFHCVNSMMLNEFSILTRLIKYII